MVLDRLTDLPYTEHRTAAIEEVSIEWNDTTNFVFASFSGLCEVELRILNVVRNTAHFLKTMKKDLITKIKTTVAKKEHIDEEGIRSLMILIRKLLDKMPQSDQNSYLTVRLFCNWAAHNEITQSNTGLRILAEINDALVSIKNSTDTIAMQTKMSQAIGLSVLREELKMFFGDIKVDDVLVSDNKIWAVFISNLIEIIRDVPLSFPQLSKLKKTKQKIYNRIAQNPIKPGAGVISIQISRVDYAALGAQEVGDIMCLLIRTEDTTTTIIPLLIDVRL